jgi:hypothetical protein
MTVISALLSPKYIIVSTDSMLSSKDGGKWIANKSSYNKNIKFVPYKDLRCIASYFGMASIEENGECVFNTLEWLKSKGSKQHEFETILSFGEHLRDELTNEFIKRKFKTRRTIGIHLTGFELFDGKWIPEMFYISGDSQAKICQVSRRTYLDWKSQNTETQVPLSTQRREFNDYIMDKPYIYNNGDNTMFNIFAMAYQTAMSEVNARGILKGGIKNEKHFVNLTRIPIDAIKDFQRKYYVKDSIIVGGKTRTMIMYNDGTIKYVDPAKENLF